MVSQKCQYALRAVFELAKQYGKGPVKIADIANAQAIPQRFLEVILSQLKQAGLVESRRGSEGGYFLILSPTDVTVGEVIQFIEGPIGPVACNTSNDESTSCPLLGSCVFLSMWDRVRKAVSGIYDNTTLQGLIDEEARMQKQFALSYTI